jgi:probable rRNA maturation factor
MSELVRRIHARRLKQIAETALTDLLGVEAFELCIHLVGAREITRLNETFLRHAGSTDVITFNYSDARAGSPLPAAGSHRVTRPTLRGEIFICVDEALRQARRFRTTWQSEIVRYLVHGVLHLLGHDDQRASARRKMKREEDRLFRQLAKQFRFSGLSRKS